MTPAEYLCTILFTLHDDLLLTCTQSAFRKKKSHIRTHSKTEYIFPKSITIHFYIPLNYRFHFFLSITVCWKNKKSCLTCTVKNVWLFNASIFISNKDENNLMYNLKSYHNPERLNVYSFFISFWGAGNTDLELLGLLV